MTKQRFNENDDVPQPQHKLDVFSEDHAVVMATSCVLGDVLNTARLGGKKKEKKKRPTGGTDVGVAG